MEWPIYYRDSLILGNPFSPLAVCTLWSKKESIKLPKEKFCVIGNLYTNYGINPMLKNLLANPRIRYLVLCGSDLSGTGNVVKNLIELGIDESYRVKGCEAYVEKTIPREKIEILRKNLRLVDLRNDPEWEEKLVKIASHVPEKSDYYAEPIVIGEASPVTEELKAEDRAFRVEGKTIAETWLKVLDTVLKWGEIKPTEYGVRQKEALDVIAVVNSQGNLPEWLPVKKEEIEAYCKNFFGREKPSSVDYTYGERLFSLEFTSVNPKTVEKAARESEAVFNQIEWVVSKLKEKPYTRRAIAVTWRHERDSQSENPPCLVEIVWNVKQGKLYQTCTFRSHDIYRAWLFNVFALRRLQEEIAERLGLQPGSLIVLSVSAHVYESNWEEAERLVEKYYRGRITEFEPDPRGYFTIKVENGLIVVEHWLNDGRKTKYEFRGRSSEEIYRQILNENLVSRLDHAAYLGKELARAEEALKTGKKYVQDKA